MDERRLDKDLVIDLMKQAIDDSGWTHYELACSMKCSVRAIKKIMTTGIITERQWQHLNDTFADIYDTTREMEMEYMYG